MYNKLKILKVFLKYCLMADLSALYLHFHSLVSFAKRDSLNGGRYFVPSFIKRWSMSEMLPSAGYCIFVLLKLTFWQNQQQSDVYFYWFLGSIDYNFTRELYNFFFKESIYAGSEGGVCFRVALNFSLFSSFLKIDLHLYRLGQMPLIFFRIPG
jgi:hypothetical protein